VTSERDAGSLSDAAYAVLGLLSYRDATGYDLNRTAKRNVNLMLAPGKSRIYVVLPQLHERGLVTRRTIVQRGRPDKQLYSLTRAGRRAFETWLNDTSAVPTRPQLLLKLFFGAKADLDALRKQVRSYRDAAADEITLLRSLDETNKADGNVFASLTVSYGVAVDSAAVHWADEALDVLKRLARTRTRRSRTAA
jgi:PadR family transcriptional regulator, regulatory protein AphA